MKFAKGLCFGLLAGTFGGLIAAAPASALPKGPVSSETGAASIVDNVHWRGWRHCHWRHGERFCHGGRRWGWGGPGVTIDIAPGRRHHRDWDRGDRHRHRGRD